MIIKELKRDLKIPKLEFSEIYDIDKDLIIDNIGRRTVISNIGFEVPRKPGIYIFYNSNKEVMYIGKAKDLRTRYINHIGSTRTCTEDTKVKKARHINKDNIKYYSYAICDNEEEACMYEMIYSYKYKPVLQYIKMKDIK